MPGLELPALADRFATMNAARALLEGLIDYAGLFPPASLSMPQAVNAYAGYLDGDDRALLGRFVVPATRLDEFSDVAAPFLSRGGEPWHLSVIATADPSDAREKALHFNCSHSASTTAGHAICESIEIPVKSAADISRALGLFPAFFELFLEIPLDPDPADLIGALSGTRAAAKMRTGGTVESAIPDAAHILRFIRACSVHHVRFKATAGLHHAVRGSYPLTYEADAAAGVMFGYLNIFLASVFLADGMRDADLMRLLNENEPSAFRFDSEHVSWRDHSASLGRISEVRRDFAMSFGSCSFTEPITEGKQLGFL